jgi:hypothetical protein
MELKKMIKWKLFIALSMFTFQSFGTTDIKAETHKLLVSVNKNWENLNDNIEFTFIPDSEEKLIQLHLLNVVAYLESQSLSKLDDNQKNNRLLNISILKDYCKAGSFPTNNITTFRTPIFIDSENTHCAVGFLLKENGLEGVAQEIAKDQLLSYLSEINHPKLIAWQKTSGLSLFELALVQPTYGPPIPVCASPSPIEWTKVKTKNSIIAKLFDNKKESALYALFQESEFGLKQNIKRYSKKNNEWTLVGSEISGEILDLVFCENDVYLSVILPNENYSHQLLKLEANKWVKFASFNGSIKSIQIFNRELYILGNFSNVNNNISSNFVVVNGNKIKPFNPIGLRNSSFDHIKSSETVLFLTSNGGIYKFKDDTIKYLNSIQYYGYINNFNLDAVEDSLYVSSFNFGGYSKYFDKSQSTFYINNMIYGHDYPYSTVHFTKTKMINGKMLIAGDFKSSTLIPQINDERYLVKCKPSESSIWFGEGLMYQFEQMLYPILDKGIVLDFVLLNNKIFILKKDGSISYTDLNLVEDKIVELRKKSHPQN